MTDTAIIRLDLGIPAGSETCGACRHRSPSEYRTEKCDIFKTHLEWFDPDGHGKVYIRCPACLAAEKDAREMREKAAKWDKEMKSRKAFAKMRAEKDGVFI